jgi:hypothetical protein
MSYLNSKKQNALVSGTNIKTINGQSILGSGNLVVTGSGASWGSITGTLSSQTDLQTALNTKQDTLVSATNIKTINGNSLLGPGDLTLSATPPAGTMVLIYTDEVQTTGNTATTAKTYTLASNTYSRIMVEAEVEFINNANLNGNASFNIIINTVTKRTLVLSGDATGTGDQFQSGGTAKYSEPLTGGGTISITTTSVANASWKVFALRVYGIY